MVISYSLHFYELILFSLSNPFSNTCLASIGSFSNSSLQAYLKVLKSTWYLHIIYCKVSVKLSNFLRSSAARILIYGVIFSSPSLFISVLI